MRIFLTGGTGFIGSHFLNQALAAGHEVICQRRSPQSQPRVKLVAEPRWLDLPLDVIDAGHFQGADVLVHLASHTPNVPYDTFERCHYWNVMSALRLLERALEAGLKNWVVAGSCFEYGKSGEHYDSIPTNAPLEPVGSYPTSKAAASVATIGLANTTQANLFLGRIFQVFGEGEADNRLWPSLRKAALAGEDFPMTLGEQIRDFIPVEDVAARFLEEAIRLGSAGVASCESQAESIGNEPAASSQPATGEAARQPATRNPQLIRIANVGSGRPQSLRQFAEHWWQHWGAKGQLLFGAVPYRENEVMRYVPEV